MPAISLVICLRDEFQLLDRLLRQTAGCYDELVVVHDGLENELDAAHAADIVTERYSGHLFFRQREYQQEPHWPFAWSCTRHDWILRLDADEIPSQELKNWLTRFREAEEPPASISGYTCIWPLWDGRRVITRKWPAGRIFLLHKERVRFFGMVEQVPVPDVRFEPVSLILDHRPARKSYGFRNLVLRQQAFRWRRVIARSLLGLPTDLRTWRWSTPEWPAIWESIRRSPLRTGLYRLIVWPIRTLRDMWRIEGRVVPSAALFNGLHHFLIALQYWRLRRSRARK